MLSNGKNQDQLFDLIEFGSQCQKLSFARQSALVFWIEGNTRQVIANPETHQVITGELLAGESVTSVFVHLPITVYSGNDTVMFVEVECDVAAGRTYIFFLHSCYTLLRFEGGAWIFGQ